MGLDTSHDCWHGAYSAFGRWRQKLCEIAGYGQLESHVGFGGITPWPTDDPLCKLLDHSDCDGEILVEDCAPLAARLTELLPALKRSGEGGGHVGSYYGTTVQFICGLLKASSNNENVTFQ
jgi:hypothetical protein